MTNTQYVIGVDYGTDSVRSILVDASNGQELSSSVFHYPRWKKGLYCDASQNMFRQHPLDYVEGLEATVKECINKAGIEGNLVRAISIDTTGSTPVAVDATGTPLALLPEFAENPNAMFVLWRDHTGVKEAVEINAHATKFDINYLQFVGGIYSSEWFWAKLLHVLKEDESVRKNIASWVEHCDWIPFLLTGGNDVKNIKRGVCSAGHKALWSEAFGGFPPNEFFASLDSVLDGFVYKLPKDSYTADKPAGTLSAEWAQKLGLTPDVVVGIGAFDAHMGAVGGQVEPYHLSKVMGTSTCDMLVAPKEDMQGVLVAGICGQVDGSVIPNMIGLEAGQSAFGDVYAWFKKVMMWPLEEMLDQSNVLDASQKELLRREFSDKMIPMLTAKASSIEWKEDDALAIDWMNGRRTPDADQELKGAISNISLGTDAPRIFYALVEATCFGAKAIVDRFIQEGIPVKGLIGLGGVAKRSPFIMQMMADVMDMPIRIHKSEQTCALGAAMFAATAAGIFAKVEDAMEVMGQGFETTYMPDASKTALYKKRYAKYHALGTKIEELTKQK